MTVSVDKLKEQLEVQREQLKLELATFEPEPNNGLGYSTHPADDASIAEEQAAEIAIKRNTERLLYQVERALFRMEEGTYGICRECGKRIDDARLNAIPYTRLCIDCATRHEED